NDLFQQLKNRLIKTLEKALPNRKLVVTTYLLLTLVLAGIAFASIGKDLLPRTNNGQFQMRVKLPDGTRLERTEDAVKKVLAIVDSTVSGHVDITSAYVGLVPSSYGTSNLYAFNTGTHEAIIQVHLDDDYKINMDELKDALRKNIAHDIPDLRINFEPVDLTEKIMSQGANNPIEVRVAGKNMEQIEGFADTLTEKLKKIKYLRDVQIAQPLHMPVINIKLDRLKIAQLGLNIKDVSNSVTAATSSSRFVEKNLWLDEHAAYTYQVQVQVPTYEMNSVEELKEIPLIKGKNRPNLGDVATFEMTTAPGEYDRAGPRRYLTVAANVNNKDLGTATGAVEQQIKSMGQPPRGVKVEVRGMSSLLNETLADLQKGLLFAILVILLLLAANYESFKLALTVVTTVPAVILGSLLLLFLTGSTLNLQSYMGMIMSTGVSVANAILIVTNAENLRLSMKDAHKAAVTSASIRLRPILMTSLAMVVGMIPMASGMGEAGEQTAPLGRAVIGGLIASTLAALFVLPLVYAWVQENTDYKNSSLMPE
ncbi:MAG TPA: efflux RND transporter permease subunit, partial [Chitinophagales bacterium]|nr:efflux RND transporter permease subunit [Chitinophagales bacterium]